MTIINDFEKKIYSQNGEDGIIEYIFSLIGTTSKSFIEFGFSTSNECNSANLFLNKDWNGLLIDANKKRLNKSIKNYKKIMGKKFNRIQILNYMLDCENINKVFIDHSNYIEIDLLSIDIDGNDYWIWKEIFSINPRVVIIEYNAHLGNEKSISVEYDPKFDINKKHWGRCYFGASLPAFEKLGKEKGYYLVGCDSMGVNAFFVRNDLKHENLKEVSAKDCWKPPLYKYKKNGVKDMLKTMKFIEV